MTETQQTPNTMQLATFDVRASGHPRGRPGWYVALWWLVQATLFRGSLHNAYGYRAALLRLFGAKIGKGVKIRPDAQFHFPWHVTIGDDAWIDHRRVLGARRALLA